MTVDVATENGIEIINNYESVQLETTDDGVVISLDYLSDNWDDIRSDRDQDLVSVLESMLQKLQSSKCLGRHPVRYSRTVRPGVGCDIIHIIVSLILIDNKEMDTKASELLKRLRSSDNPIDIPDDEIRELHRKLGQSRRKKTGDLAGTFKYRWRL